MVRVYKSLLPLAQLCTEDRTTNYHRQTRIILALSHVEKRRVTTSSTLLRQGASSLLEYLR